MAMKHIAILALNNRLGASLISMLDIFSVAAEMSCLKISVVTTNGESIASRSGVNFPSDYKLTQAPDADAIIISSCINYKAQLEYQRDTILPWLHKQSQQGAIIGALNSGIVVLSMSGLLDNQKATSDWNACTRLQQVFPKVEFDPNQNLIASDKTVTSSGAYASESLSLYIIEKLLSPDIAEACIKELTLNTERRKKRRSNKITNRKHKDDRIHTAQNWIEENFNDEINLSQLAHMSNMSLRNFIRRFKDACGETPISYIQRLRIEEAKRLLQHTTLTVESISLKVGYQTESYFRQLFKRHTKLTPNQFRKNGHE